jgi:hypothetical protein
MRGLRWATIKLGYINCRIRSRDKPHFARADQPQKWEKDSKVVSAYLNDPKTQ